MVLILDLVLDQDQNRHTVMGNGFRNKRLRSVIGRHHVSVACRKFHAVHDEPGPEKQPVGT